MAHELNFVNGQAQMFSVRLTPWHEEGQVLTDAPTYEGAITLAGLDYPVEKRPYWMPTPDGTMVEGKDAFYTMRPDTGDLFGTVGGSYEVVPNRDAFEVLKPLVDAGVLTLETGGVLRKGADAWLLGKWDLDRFGPEAREVLGGEVLPYSTVLANHSGRRGILLGSTPVRIVCANTLGYAETDGRSRWESVMHTKGAKIRLVEVAEQLFAGVVERYEVIARQYRLLKDTLLTEEGFRRMVLDVVAPDPREDAKFTPEAKLAKVVVERAERKRAEVARLWREGAGHDGSPNCWFAYNGAVEALDFNRDLWPTRAGCWRTASLLDGALAQMKQKVLTNLVGFAQAV